MMNPTDLQNMLVTAVACGDASLEKLLSDNVDTIWCISSESCAPELAYLKTQLGLIQLAQDYSRNQIDLASSRSNSAGADQYDQTSQRDSQSSRVASAQNCAWSRATSFQQFQRDSESHDRSKANATASNEGRSWDIGSDRSQQSSNGFATSFSQATSNTDGSGSGVSHAHSERNSRSSSSTGPLLSGVPNPFTFGFTISPPFFSASGGTIEAAPSVGFPCPTDPDEPCPPISSYGRGVNNSYNASVGIPTIGPLRVDWGDGESFQQSFVCSGGSTSMDSTAYSTQQYSQTDTASNSSNATSHDESSNQKNIHRTGESHSTGSSHATAGSSGVSASHGESHTGSDRSSHSESESTGTGMASSKSTMRGLGTGYNDAESVSTARYWSQIFDSLAAMWARIFEEVQIAEKLLLTSTAVASGRMQTVAVGMLCAKQGNAVLARLNRPCPTIRGLPKRVY